MRIFVTGATGFVGAWLIRELEAARHIVIPSPPSSEVSIEDAPRLREILTAARPDGVIHLAGVAFAPDAAADPTRAVRTNVGGTSALLGAAGAIDPRPVVLIVSSSEVYGAPDPAQLPIPEDAPLRPRHVYGATKLAQEASALWAASRDATPIAIARPFNHTGPGQRNDFAVAAFVERVHAARSGDASEIRVGNVDVSRDITDVRDVVHAYRLLIERLATDRPASVEAFNIATGRAIAMREVISTLCELSGVTPRLAIDSALIRSDDPPVIVGDSTRIRRATGWIPAIPLTTTLADMLADAQQH